MKNQNSNNHMSGLKTAFILCIGSLCLLPCVPHVNAQDGSLDLKYLGTAGWEITDGNVTILVDPYISRLKLGSGPSTSTDDTRKSYARTDFFESDTVSINKIITKADYILVHHSHLDHLSDVPYIAKKTGAKVIATEQVVIYYVHMVFQMSNFLR